MRGVKTAVYVADGGGPWRRWAAHRCDSKAGPAAAVVAPEAAAVAEKRVYAAILAPGHRPQVAAVGLALTRGPIPTHRIDVFAVAVRSIPVRGGSRGVDFRGSFGRHPAGS